MFRATKKCLSILLALLVVLTCVWSAFTVQAASDALFEDKFSNSALTGWGSANVGSVSGGVYTVNGTGVNPIASVGSGEALTIMADVKIERASANANGYYPSGMATLAFLSSADLTSGYEFGLGINKDGSTYAVVYKTGADAKIVYQRAVNIPGVEGGKVKPGVSYALKVITVGKTALCYINNALFYELSVSSVVGYMGVSSWCAKSTYDNVAVYRTGEKKLEKIELQNTPAEITVAGAFKFDILATYGGVYGTEVLSSEDKGVTVTGLDGKLGKKTLTVGYGGKTATFTTNVVKFTEQVLYAEDFEGDVKGWSFPANKTDPITASGQISGGKLWAAMPTISSNSPYSISINYDNAKTLMPDLYYSISVDATIKADSTTETFRPGAAALRFVNSAGNYQFRISSTGDATLYNGSTQLLASASCAGEVALNKTVRMQVKVMGRMAVCYLNGKELFTCNFEPKDATSLLSFFVLNGAAEFDNVQVTKLEGKSKWAVKNMKIVNASGTEVSSYAGRSFNPTKYFLSVNYLDGTNFMVPITKDMVEGYNASVKTTQNIKIVYGNQAAKFSVTYKDYLFHTDFSNGMELGVVASSNDSYAPYSIRNGMLMVNYTKPEDNATVTRTFRIEEGVSEYTNYSVSADVALLDGNAAKTQYACINLRSGSGTSYSYRLIYSTAGTVNLYLYHNVGTGNELIRQWAPAQLLKTYEDPAGKSIELNTLYNLKVEIIENKLYCYFNNVLLEVVSDEHPNYKEAPGNVSFSAINTGAAFDNIYIYPLENRDPVGFTVEGDNVKDGVLQVYQGYEIEPQQVTLNVNYTDGYKASHPLWSEYIVSGYDPNVLGEQTITIKFEEITSKVRVNVYERPEYLAAFVDKVNALKPGSLTTNDATAVNEMIRYFGTLSTFEISKIGDEVYKKYTDLVTEMDKLSNAALKDAEQLANYDFTKSETFVDDWGIDQQTGTLTIRNGSFVNEQKKKNVSGQTLIYNKASYGKILSAEADIMLLYPATYTALVIYASEGSYYHARLTNKPTDQDGNPVMTVQLYKCAEGSQKNLGAIYPILKGINVVEGEWHNLRMDLNEGVIGVYLDDVLMIQYDDSQSTDYITDGYIALRNSEQDAKYDNFRAYGIKKDPPQDEYVKQIETTYYEDDFEDETVGKDPSHWIEFNTKNEWKVFNKGGSKVYGVSKKEKTFSWLHAFEIDPIYTAKLMATSGTGRVGLITRLVNEAAHLAIGYDFAQKKWYFASNGSEDVKEQLYYAEKSTGFALGEWHDVEVVLDDKNLAVKCDGETVLEYKDVYYASFGRMGVFAENSDVYIDDVKIASKNGAIFGDGVVEITLNTEDYVGSMEIEDITEDLLVGTFGGKKYVSTDAGQTFMTAGEYGRFTNLPDSGYPSYLDLGDGKWLAVKNATDVYISNDDMDTWNCVAQLVPKEEWYSAVSGTFLPIIHTSSLTKITMPNGVTRIFCPVAVRNADSAGNIVGHYATFYYSDDGGYTWTKSLNDSRDIIPNYNNSTSTTYAEGKIIACSDGTIRYMQTRNKTGSTIYLESKDYGVTWTEFGKIPFMQAPVGSFGIEEDPENPGTYYMAWVNCYPSSMGSILPRTRLSLARTTDGKNWEFLTDVFRTSDFDAEYNDIRQIVDPSVTVTKEYVYVTYSVASKWANSAHNALRIRYCRFEKDNLTVHEWNDATISDTTAPAKIEINKLPQTKFGYSDLFNTNGLEIKVTALNGTEKVEGRKKYFLVDGEPNMFKLGKQTVRLMSDNYMFVEYEIEVVPNYDVLWTIKGKGTVTPEPDSFTRIMEGASQTFTLKPNKGYKVGEVVVNGKKVTVTKNTFTIENVTENQEITVTFAKKTVLDYLLWIILALVVVAGIAVAAIWLIRKQKKKPVPGADMEDISSNSTPPTDEN